MIISIGNAYDNNANISGHLSVVEVNHPADGTGTLNALVIYTFYEVIGLKVGTFFTSGAGHKMRDSILVGDINGYVTPTGLNCSVAAGDFIGAYWVSGYLQAWNNVANGEYKYNNLDIFDGNEHTGGTFFAASPFLGGSGVAGAGAVVPDAPTNFAATKNQSDKVTLTWTKSTGAAGYKIYKNSVLLATVGDVATYDDTSMDAPTITSGGSASATDGSLKSSVTLTVSGQSIANGTTATYYVTATNSAGESSASGTDTGYRLASSLTFQWQRSSADLSGSFTDISGATTNPYSDTGAPSDGSIRQFRCVVSAVNSTTVYSSIDSGCRAAMSGGVSRARIVNGA